MTLHLPPLRQRCGDIRLLARHFAGEEWTIDADAMDAMEGYRWPGNVRQLINAIDRAKILADAPRIELRNLPPVIGQSATCASCPADRDTLADLERRRVIQALEEERGNKLRAARALGVSRRTLYRLLQKHRIEPGA